MKRQTVFLEHEISLSEELEDGVTTSINPADDVTTPTSQLHASSEPLYTIVKKKKKERFEVT